MKRSSRADAHLPLTPLDLSVLLVLTEGASYGYGIVKAVSERSRGAIELAPGNVYQALDRLISHGWIEELGPGRLPEGAAPRRRYYAITPQGTRVAAAEARRLTDMMPSLERALLPLTDEG